MDQDRVEAYKHTHKRERGLSPVIAAQDAWPIKYIYTAYASVLGKFFLRDTARNPRGKDSVIVPNRVTNHSAGFGSCIPLTSVTIK